jgi:HEAT repeat protein
MAGRLKWANAESVRAEVQAGRALLLLDGLDEMGGERTEKLPDGREERYDPRQRFIAALNHQLGTNKALVTCRIADYEAIGSQVALEGAVTLQKLTDAQMRTYLAGDDLAPLQAAIDADEALREMARTPLLLSYLAFAFRDRPEALRELKDLREGALRDAIFNAYIDQRYAREAKRLKLMGKTPPFTLDFIRDTLGRLAMENAGGKRRRNTVGDNHVDNVVERRDFALVLADEQIDPFIGECLMLHFLARRPEGLGFIHLKLRDTLVYGFSLPRLRDAALYDYVDSRTRYSNPVIALTAIRDLRAVEPLVELLQDASQSRGLRENVALSLGTLGDGRALEPLVELLQDPALDKADLTGPAALDGMNPYLAWLKSLVSEFDEPVKEKSSTFLRRHIVASALGELGDTRAVEPLLAAINDVDARVRASATSALREFGDARAVKPLIAALKDVNEQVRSSAANALGALGDARAVEPLIAALKNVNEQVRSSAASALGNLGDERAARPLFAALTNEEADLWVRSSAASALGKLGEVGFRWLLVAIEYGDPEVSNSVASALRELGESGFQGLLAALNDTNAKIRSSAAKALGLLGDRRAFEPLIAALVDVDAGVRSSAAEALGQVGDGRAVEPLLTALNDADEWVPRYAARALGKLGTVGFKALLDQLKNPAAYMCVIVVEALGDLKNAEAVEPLIDVLNDAENEVRRSAAKALGHLGAKWAAEPLIAALTDPEKRVRSSAADALGELGDGRAVEPLIAALNDANAEVRSNVAEALGKMRDARAVEPLIPLLIDTDKAEGANTFASTTRVCDTAARALEAIGTPEALEAVRSWRVANPPPPSSSLLGAPRLTPFGSPSSRPTLPGLLAPRPQLPGAQIRPFGSSTPPPASPPVEPVTPPPDNKDDND